MWDTTCLEYIELENGKFQDFANIIALKLKEIYLSAIYFRARLQTLHLDKQKSNYIISKQRLGKGS